MEDAVEIANFQPQIVIQDVIGGESSHNFCLLRGQFPTVRVRAGLRAYPDTNRIRKFGVWRLSNLAKD
eukprot:CAMPEP_0174295400 /NCGR_PEP_ID=MMETSP0809-20121228/44625_1 /TAXON_ID=73025 ORGANISM="Eutreptiella gymnastica-like, Strain CCMP1594" /NCGR_SAMPLE_ID=MMETSP0809 /ASSEMBLY_ACC=CAM_ASM_000658 /LENGTH=67 /DNA_ID=CAMNT_0015397651 /DNA_START=477 /DNA_END=677 /DNA_ORIENTATION=-